MAKKRRKKKYDPNEMVKVALQRTEPIVAPIYSLCQIGRMRPDQFLTALMVVCYLRGVVDTSGAFTEEE